MTDPGGFPIDEAPLRQWILRAYQDGRKAPGASRRALDAVRQFLSGAPGGESVVSRYWFEEDPPASMRSFIEDLEKAAPGLARSTLDPLLAAAAGMEARRSRELAPNISVYVSNLAGAVALKSGIDETVACSVLSAAIIGLSRAGSAAFEEALAARESSK